MDEEDPEPKAPGLGEQLWAAAPRLLIMISALTVMYAVLTWLTGGVRPQSQIDLDNLKSTQTGLASRVAVCESRLDALPRTADFSNWEAHLSRLDAVFEAQRDQVTQNKYDIKDLMNKYQALTTVPPRK
jgi:hypothetical protein